MGMTMTQKILAAHAGLPEVKAGQLIRAKLDMVLGNDITSPVAIREFDKEGFTGVFDKSKISMVMDHFTPNKDIKAAEQCLQCRTFAHRFDIDNFYDVGQMGVEHALLPEKGLVAAGEGAHVEAGIEVLALAGDDALPDHFFVFHDQDPHHSASLLLTGSLAVIQAPVPSVRLSRRRPKRSP